MVARADISHDISIPTLDVAADSLLRAHFQGPVDAAAIGARTSYDAYTYIVQQQKYREAEKTAASGKCEETCKDSYCLLQRENAKADAKHSAFEVELLHGQLKEKNSEITWLRSQMDRQCDQLSTLTHVVKERKDSLPRRLWRRLVSGKKTDSAGNDTARTKSDRESIRRVFG
ncbi:MAG: hypothetical protein LUQ40_00690 [Methanomicrobiales archaeon]|nr:hypothetical protein [Methanomicrobiales archaeon]